MTFYAVAKGNKVGVYTSWNECSLYIKDFNNPVFKKFDTIEEATSFIEDFNQNLYIYTDGACINNGSDNARAGIGIYFSKDDLRNVSKELLKEDDKKLTNNIAELKAVIEAIKIVKNDEIPNKIIITDSEYVIKCATTYGKKLSENNWKTKEGKNPPNYNLVKKLYELTIKYNIKYKHVNSHTGNKDKHSIGNYYADLFANKAIGIDNKKETKDNKIYLNVSYNDKDDAKFLGARWDINKKKWYTLDNNKNKEILFKKYGI
jgi:ribonuclease HI